MKIVIAIDSFKESSTSIAAGEAVSRGILNIAPNTVVVNMPVADGGEGTTEAVVGSDRGKIVKHIVTGPMGKQVQAEYGALKNGSAVMEMSSASGLHLVPEDKRNPLVATTYGTGELIKAILDEGYRSILIGLGGSATNDGGAGMMQALGVSFKDADGNELDFGGGPLSELVTIDISNIDPRLSECDITIASDVSNVLCGKSGASHVYGPQKGATPEMVEELDSALGHYAKVIQETLGIDVANINGSGAAGGIGAAFNAFFKLNFESGIESVLKIIDFDSEIKDADLVITGEGRIDSQTAFGKVPIGVARHAKDVRDIPVIAFAGIIAKGAKNVYSSGIDAMYCIADGPISLQESKERTFELLEKLAESVMRTILVGQSINK